MLHRARQPPGAAGWAGGGGREGIWGAGNEEGWGWGGHPQPLVTPGGPSSPPGLEWRVRGGGSRSPLGGAARGAFVLEGARVGAGARESEVGTLCHIPFGLGLGRGLPSHRRLSSLVSQLCSSSSKVKFRSIPKPRARTPARDRSGGLRGRSASVEPPVGCALAPFQGGDPGPECSLPPHPTGGWLWAVKTTSLPSCPSGQENIKKKKRDSSVDWRRTTFCFAGGDGADCLVSLEAFEGRLRGGDSKR